MNVQQLRSFSAIGVATAISNASGESAEVGPLANLEENPLRCFGPDTAGSCVGSAHFPLKLVRDFSVCASSGFPYDAEADAASFNSHLSGLHEVCASWHHLSRLEAARRSRACAYLADDDHGPLALQEILLAGCPTVGVRTGASFVRTGETGIVVDRLPPGRQCAESDDDLLALAVFLEAIEQAQSMDRQCVRERAAEEFDTDRIVDSIITAVDTVRLAGGIERAASV